MATQSAYDVTGQAFQRGAKAEDRFMNVLKTRFPGKRVSPASPMEETREHWDYKLCMDPSCDSSKAIKYEVKGARKIEMRDANVQDKWFPVEFLTVGGYPGWARGRATWIAFETLSDWILVKPADLLNLAIRKIKEVAAKRGIAVNTLEEILAAPDLRANRSSDALYKVYGRAGRGDALTWIRKEDILTLPHEIWKEGEVSSINEPPMIRAVPKRGQMGPGGKQLWNTDVSIWQGTKLISTVMLTGKWDQAKVEETLKASLPQEKWTVEALVQQLKTNPRFTGQPLGQPLPVGAGFKEWVIWHEQTIIRTQ